MRSNIKQITICTFIISICISPVFALGENNRNLALIAIMGLSPIFLFCKPIIMPKIDIPLLIFCVSMIAFPLLFHPETMRWSTVLYSYMFCLFFITYTRLFHYNFTIETYSNLLKGLLYAYCITLILQQLCVLFHIPIINLGNYDPLEPWKLNSLASEPSHTARFVAILMYSFLLMQDKTEGKTIPFTESYKNNKITWIAFFWIMITSISGTAIFMALVIFLRYISKRQIIRGALMTVILFLIIPFIHFTPVERMYKLSKATLSLNKKEMLKADHSGSLRLVPMMVCFEKIDLTTLDGWTGRGIDYASKIMYREVPGMPKGLVGGGYGIIALEYGFMVFLIITFFTFRICYNNNNKLQSCILWLMCCFLLGLNMQIAWAFIILSYTNKQFKLV